MQHGNEVIEKWVLRKVVEGLIPDNVLWRKKAKFWQGAGVGELLAKHAEGIISDSDFQRERILPSGWKLNTKEELMYYRIFKEHFGELESLEGWGALKERRYNKCFNCG
jgi:asparagine synthase (glutamine-hydrolysing)